MRESTTAPTLKQEYDKHGPLCWALGIPASSFSTSSLVSWKHSKVVKLHRSLDVPDGAESVKGAGAPESAGCQGCGEAAGKIPVFSCCCLISSVS